MIGEGWDRTTAWLRVLLIVLSVYLAVRVWWSWRRRGRVA